jgi:hypothetical protein
VVGSNSSYRLSALRCTSFVADPEEPKASRRAQGSTLLVRSTLCTRSGLAKCARGRGSKCKIINQEDGAALAVSQTQLFGTHSTGSMRFAYSPSLPAVANGEGPKAIEPSGAARSVAQALTQMHPVAEMLRITLQGFARAL